MEENLGGNQLTQVHLEKWPLKLNVCVVYLTVSTSSDVFRGGLVRGPPPLWPDRRDFCNYFGIIFSAV